MHGLLIQTGTVTCILQNYHTCTHMHTQFHLQQSEVVRVREIALDLPQNVQDDMKNVTQLIASQDGLYIYALTPRKVKQH